MLLTLHCTLINMLTLDQIAAVIIDVCIKDFTSLSPACFPSQYYVGMDSVKSFHQVAQLGIEYWTPFFFLLIIIHLLVNDNMPQIFSIEVPSSLRWAPPHEQPDSLNCGPLLNKIFARKIKAISQFR